MTFVFGLPCIDPLLIGESITLWWGERKRHQILNVPVEFEQSVRLLTY